MATRGMNGHFILALPLPSRSACNNPAMLAIAACLLRTILCHLAIVGSKSYEGDEPTLRKRAKPKWIEKTNCLFLAVLLICQWLNLESRWSALKYK